MTGGIQVKLVVAEKPSVGKAIAQVVGAQKQNDGYMEGNGYRVTWCIGHLIELASPDAYLGINEDENKKHLWNLDELPIVPSKWKFAISQETKKQYFLLKKMMNADDVDYIICATDAGREGECIFRYVYNLSKSRKPVKRLWVSSMEEKTLKEGMADLKDDKEYDRLYNAGLARAKADWLIGMNLSRLFSVKYKSLLSVGRVQTPTLAMICERYEKFKNFTKEYYYTVEIDLDGFKAVSAKKYDKKEMAENIRKECEGTKAKVLSYINEKKRTPPPVLYDLTTLQRVANKLYGYTAQKTLDITQKLYEMKLVTYPRTDSSYITDDMEETAKRLVLKLNGFDTYKEALEGNNPDVRRLINNKKVSDHHALMPTDNVTNDTFEKLESEQRNILDAICKRLLTAVMPAQEYLAVKAVFEVKGQTYNATEKTVISDGFKALEKRFRDKNDKVSVVEKRNSIPDLQKGQIIDIAAANTAEHETAPPKPYTDDTLLKAMEIAGNEEYKQGMEKKGIGTTATRAGILETLVKRGYIIREKKQLIPTDNGINLIKILPNTVTSAKITASWEMALQNIEKGKAEETVFMQQIEELTKKLVEEYKNSDVDEKLFIKKIGSCPLCKSDVIEYPKVFKCSNRECNFVIFREVAKKQLTSYDVQQLLSAGHTGTIQGFKNKEGKSFNAKLEIVIEDEQYEATEVMDSGKKYKLNFIFTKRRKYRKKNQ